MNKKSLMSFILCLILIFSAACAAETPPDPNPGGETPVNYKITFDTGLGTYIAPYIAKAGTPVSEPPVPVNEGHKFSGWYLGNSIYEFFLMPSKSITLTAKWDKLYKITFITGAGADTVNTIEFTQGENIVLPANPGRTGYMFLRWDLNGVEFTIQEMPASDIVLTAVWIETNSIIFDLGAEADALGIEMEPLYGIGGTSISEPEQPRVPGYVFYGWADSAGKNFTFDKMPAAKVTTLTAKWFEASVLPSMLIELSDGFGNRINIGNVDRVNYVKSTVSVQNADESHNFRNAEAEFRGRGNGSWTDNGGTGKRGYRIKFGSKLPLFGYASNKHWAIVPGTNEGGGSGGDKTMMQNMLAYGLGREVFDGLEYTTKSELVDIYINGSFHGVYLLAEIVRVDKGRIDIESQYGINDTGYLIEYDTYASGDGPEGIYWFRAEGEQKYPFTVKSPDPDDYAANGMSDNAWRSQVAWLSGQVSALMRAIFNKDYATFSTLADVDSFVDMYLLHELFKNVDTGWSSLFLYKKPGGKFYMGSPWDFDMSANTTRGDKSFENLYVAGTGTGSCKQASSHTYSEMFHALYNTPGFFNEIVKRWKVVAPEIKEYINSAVSASFVTTHTFAMGRNFYNFSAYGYASQSAAETAWTNNVATLKNWLISRTDWLTGGPWK